MNVSQHVACLTGAECVDRAGKTPWAVNRCSNHECMCHVPYFGTTCEHNVVIEFRLSFGAIMYVLLVAHAAMLSRCCAFLAHHLKLLAANELRRAEAASSPALVLYCSTMTHLLTASRYACCYNFPRGPCLVQVPWSIFGVFEGGAFSAWVLSYVIITLHWIHAARDSSCHLVATRTAPYLKGIVVAAILAVAYVVWLAVAQKYQTWNRLNVYILVGIWAALTAAALVVLRRLLKSRARASLHIPSIQDDISVSSGDARADSYGQRILAIIRGKSSSSSSSMMMMSEWGKPARYAAQSGGFFVTKSEVAPFKMIRLGLLLIGWCAYSYFCKNRLRLERKSDARNYVVVEAVRGVLWAYNSALIHRISFVGLRARWRRSNPHRKVPRLVRDFQPILFCGRSKSRSFETSRSASNLNSDDDDDDDKPSFDVRNKHKASGQHIIISERPKPTFDRRSELLIHCLDGTAVPRQPRREQPRSLLRDQRSPSLQSGDDPPADIDLLPDCDDHYSDHSDLSPPTERDVHPEYHDSDGNSDLDSHDDEDSQRPSSFDQRTTILELQALESVAFSPAMQ